MIAIGRPTAFSTPRMRSIRAFLSAWSPWLMFSRNTSTPARNSVSMASADEDAGPKVAMIRVRR